MEAPNNIEDIKRAIQSVDAPVSINMTEGGKTPLVTIEQLERWGAARVSAPVTTLFGAYRGVYNALKVLKEKGTTRENPELLVGFEEFLGLIGMPAYKEAEKRYLPQEVFVEKYGR